MCSNECLLIPADEAVDTLSMSCKPYARAKGRTNVSSRSEWVKVSEALYSEDTALPFSSFPSSRDTQP
jgi:hypothetical protein